jgi:recombination protein RecA
LLDIAALHNIVEKSGAWYSYKGERIGQGRENARAFLKENKDTLIKLDAEVRKQLGLTTPAAPTAVPAPAAPAQSPPQTGRVTTMPSAVPEPAKVPAARR